MIMQDRIWVKTRYPDKTLHKSFLKELAGSVIGLFPANKIPLSVNLSIQANAVVRGTFSLKLKKSGCGPPVIGTHHKPLKPD